MRNYLIFLVIFLAFGCARTEEFKLTSPDGRISLYFLLDDESPSYYIAFHDTLMIDTSRLVMEFADMPALGPGLSVGEVVLFSDYRNWEPAWGEESRIREHYNRLLVGLEESQPPHRTFQLEFKAFNDGVGFRYIFPEQENWDTLLIMEEKTGFRLADDFTAWWIPGDYDSYEYLYRNTPVSQIDSANTPVTFETPAGRCISIHEANLTDYADMTLKPDPSNPLLLVSSLVPWPDGIKVRASIPHMTPWRTITIAEDASSLLLSRMILNLNEPAVIEDATWIRPMKYIGIWWGLHTGKYSWHEGRKHGATTENAMKYIDFAAKNGIKGVLVEGWNKGWDTWSGDNHFDFTTPYNDFDLEKVAAYASEEGIELIGHHETGGNIAGYEAQVDSAFSLYSSLGIHAVKTGYAGKIRPEGQHHHGQWMVNHYRSVLIKAMEHKIMINVHEPIKATGLRRTYPHMMTSEGARGTEYNAWSEGNPPSHTCILPFTRLLGGPLDYTPGIFDLHTGENNSGYRVHTTLAKQLALYVVIFSPWQMAADLPENYAGNDAFDFIREVPCNWDKTLVLGAKIGDYVTYARKKDDDWYIGAITDENARSHWVKFSFLEEGKTYEATVYEDGSMADWEENPYDIRIYRRTLHQNDSLEIKLARGGGAAIQIKAR